MKLSLETTQANCLRTVRNIGSNVVHNICSGEQVAIPWGSADWIGAIAMSGVAVLVLVAFAAFITMIVRG
jgi:hypothetical protein